MGNKKMNELLKEWKQYLLEQIIVDIKVGDVVLMGKFKNKRTVVKEIGKDEYGHPTINGKSILKLNIEKILPEDKKSKQTREGK